MGKTRKKKRLPPEDLFATAESYYQGEILDEYTHSKSLMRIQEKITKRAVELVKAETPSLILDCGAGAGFSTSYLYLMGFNVVATDLIYDMLHAYDIKEFNPVNSDMKQLPFRENSFDYIFSISAFQWIFNKTKPDERNKILQNIARIFNVLLKSSGKAIIQFYPMEEKVLKEIGTIFADFGKFKGNFIIDNPNSGPKRKIYLYLEK